MEWSNGIISVQKYRGDKGKSRKYLLETQRIFAKRRNRTRSVRERFEVQFVSYVGNQPLLLKESIMPYMIIWKRDARYYINIVFIPVSCFEISNIIKYIRLRESGRRKIVLKFPSLEDNFETSKLTFFSIVSQISTHLPHSVCWMLGKNWNFWIILAVKHWNLWQTKKQKKNMQTAVLNLTSTHFTIKSKMCYSLLSMLFALVAIIITNKLLSRQLNFREQRENYVPRYQCQFTQTLTREKFYNSVSTSYRAWQIFRKCITRLHQFFPRKNEQDPHGLLRLEFFASKKRGSGVRRGATRGREYQTGR